MKRKDVFQSKYLTQQDVPSPIRTTVATVTKEIVGQGVDQEEKAVMHFTSNLKPMVINNFNWTVMEDAYGDESDFWNGKPVVVYVDHTVMYGGKRVGGIRLRVPDSETVATTQQFWTIEQAVQNCAAVGVSRDDMIAHLKANGITAYNGMRCTPILQSLIAAKSQPEQPFDDGGSSQYNPNDIPF